MTLPTLSALMSLTLAGCREIPKTADTSSESAADTDADADTDTDADTDADGDTDTDTDADTDVCDGDGDGYTVGGGDCRPGDASAYPGAEEACGNLRDDDCDGEVDEECQDRARRFTTTERLEVAGDTGLAILWHTGNVTMCDDGFGAGEFGSLAIGYADIPDLDRPLCRAVGDWEETGTAPTGCPACDWSLELTVGNSEAHGTFCDDVGFSDGMWDGFQGSWGFADEYAYGYGSAVYELENVVFYYSSERNRWEFHTYNYAGSGYNRGDAAYMEFVYYYSWAYYYP